MPSGILKSTGSKGRFKDFTGAINYNEQDATKSTVQFTSKIESIDTEIEPRDQHLRTADFFDAPTYPEMKALQSAEEQLADALGKIEPTTSTTSQKKRLGPHRRTYMIEHRPKSELGRSDFGSFKALHHVAVGSNHDNPAHKAVGNLVVWNDDEIAAGAGVPFHGHADMEIITYVREGVVSHKDSLGNQGRMEAGDVQVMSAGTGIRHAEMSESPTKIFQIWISPRERGGEPRWGTKSFPKSDRTGRFVVLASGFKEDAEALSIRADARVMGATLNAGQSLSYDLGPKRKAYLVPARGRIKLNGLVLDTRDGATVRDERQLRIEAIEDAEIVLVDVT